MVNSPTKRLYYYTSSTNIMEILSEKQLKVSRFKDCNDTFELEAVDLKDKSFRRKYKEYVRKQERETGLLCFSKSWRSSIMWSHYAEKHVGYCLAFDVESEKAFDVSYRTSKLYPGIKLESFFDYVGKQQLVEIFGTKSLTWAYEEEVRLLIDLRDETPDKQGRYFMGFGKDIVLRKVYMGQNARISIEDMKAAVSDLNVGFVPTRRAFRTFKVTRQKDARLWPTRENLKTR